MYHDIERFFSCISFNPLSFPFQPQKGIVEYTSLDDFIERAACNGKNQTSQPKSSTSSKTGAKDSDLDEKIAELKTKTAGKEGVTGPKVFHFYIFFFLFESLVDY